MKTLGLLLACLHFTGVIALSAGFLNRTNVDVSFDDLNLVRVPEGVFLEAGLKDQPKPLQDGAELKVLKYGPYRVPAMGILENRMAFAVAKSTESTVIIISDN